MKRWFKVVDPRDMTNISVKLTEMYGYPWGGTDNNWCYSSGNIRNGVNYFHVFVTDRGHDEILSSLGFKPVQD